MPVLDRVSRIVTGFKLGILTMAQVTAQLAMIIGLPTDEMVRIIEDLKRR